MVKITKVYVTNITSVVLVPTSESYRVTFDGKIEGSNHVEKSIYRLFNQTEYTEMIKLGYFFTSEVYKDKLFLLSVSEVQKYLPVDEDEQCNDDESRLCTDMKRRCKYEGEYVWWWLRTHGKSDNAACVNVDCSLQQDGYVVCDKDIAVRPALHINTDHLQTLPRSKGYIQFAGIKWLPLDEESGLLLTNKPVCLHRFDRKSNDYEQSEIRAYLNNELLNELFTKEEQGMIVETVIAGEDSYPAA